MAIIFKLWILYTEVNCKQHLGGLDYTGNISTTRSGRQCRSWVDAAHNVPSLNLLFNNETLTQSENFCRNPGHNPDGHIASEPWCFWGVDVDQYEECDVPFCGR